MKKVVPLLAAVVGVIIGILLVKLNPKSFNLAASTKALTAARCEAHVKLSWKYDSANKPQIVIDPPETVCLARLRPLIWDILSPGKVTIEFKDHDEDNLQFFKGPFPYTVGANPDNDSRGVYTNKSGDAINSNDAEYTGRWKYTVKWHVNGNDLEADPYVCIRD
jgi:hypothetical protein